MDELTTDHDSRPALDRRDVLRRGAIVVGATVLWTTPVVKTLGARPAAAGTADDPTVTQLCPDNRGAPSNLVFRYDGGVTTDVAIEISRPNGPNPGTWCVATLLAGQTFQVPGEANPELSFTIMADGVAQHSKAHTSCSQPLGIGDRFGRLVLVGGINRDGERVGVTDPDVVATPGKCRFETSDDTEGAEDQESLDGSEDAPEPTSSDQEEVLESEKSDAEVEDDGENSDAAEQTTSAEKEVAEQEAPEKEVAQQEAPEKQVADEKVSTSSEEQETKTSKDAEPTPDEAVAEPQAEPEMPAPEEPPPADPEPVEPPPVEPEPVEPPPVEPAPDATTDDRG